ncbi:hypothetical protein EST38_g8829 [Candolleomyces aberdarensis]|uniref:Hydrophobin n=1 Tax=Candolleomyces aberdarensis TaxID=2316362 RepID=A0A4Q2DBH2_9AGAR|nr:hypothetical protein EST38_g8829 [Candolleomyces aberdarensis]
MIARIFAVLAASSVFLAASAAPAPGGHGGSVDQCNGGQVSCCNQVSEVSSVDKSTSILLSLIGVDVGSLTGLVGSNCSPISALAIGSGASCSTQQVCCQDNYYSTRFSPSLSSISAAGLYTDGLIFV